jgi:uncharacterized protein YdiU (UPF0061 family)
LNLELLQVPLEAVIELSDMAAALAIFDEHYYSEYRQLMLSKLGLSQFAGSDLEELLELTIQLLQETQVGYHDFFAKLTQYFSPKWREDASSILSNPDIPLNAASELLEDWRNLYQRILQNLPPDEMDKIAQQLMLSNPKTVLLRPVIESIWEAIANENNWQPFYELLQRISRV